MGHKKEDETAKGFLDSLLGNKPAGESASAQIGRPGGEGQWTARPHTSHYEGTSRGDGSASVDRVYLSENEQESGRKSI